MAFSLLFFFFARSHVRAHPFPFRVAALHSKFSSLHAWEATAILRSPTKRGKRRDRLLSDYKGGGVSA